MGLRWWWTGSLRRSPSRPTLLMTALMGLLSGCGLPYGGSSAATVPGYHIVAEVRLPGDTSRFDYQVLDAALHRLFIAHLGANEIVVFDTQSQQVAGVVRGIAGVHGLASAPDLHRVFASATDSNEVVSIDENTLRIVGRAPTKNYPDGIAYVPGTHRLFVSNEHGGGDTIIDAETTSAVGFVELGSDVGNSQFDPATGFVLVALHTGDLVEIDPTGDVVRHRWKLDGCNTPHGLQVDGPERHRVFVACSGNAKLLVFDLASERVSARFDIANDPDVLARDSAIGRLYVAAESSKIGVFDTRDDQISRLGEGTGGPNSHTVSVDSSTHRVYLPLTDVGGHPVLRELLPNSPAHP